MSPRWSREGLDADWYYPNEDIARDGCPAGWSRSRFIESLAAYQRARQGDGGRVENPNLSRCDDWLITDAVLEFERHEDRKLSELAIETM